MTKLSLFFAVALCLVVVSYANIEARPVTNLRERIHQEASQLGLSADVTATIEETLFQKICAAILPVINQMGANLVIPGQSASHFSFSNIVIQNFNVAGLSISFVAPNQISVAVTGLTFAVPQTEFHVFTKILFVKVSCGGNFWASLAPTNIILTLPVSESGGKLVFGTPVTNVQWGALNIDHKLKDLVCKVGQDIIQLFIGNIDSLIRKLVQQDLPAKIGPPIEAALNKALAKLPLDIVSPPVVTSNSISLTVDLLAGAGAGVHTVKPFTGHRVEPLRLPARDVFLQIPALAVNNILLFIQQRGLFNVNFTDPKFNTTLIQTIFPSVYAQCPGCPFAVETVFPAAPFVVAQSDSVQLNLMNTIFGLNIVKAGSADIPFVEIFVNASLNVTGLTVNTANKVYFQLNLQTLTFAIDHSSIGPFVPDLITSLVSYLLNNVAIPDFNKKFDGIALSPAMQNAVIDVEQSSVFFGFDLAMS